MPNIAENADGARRLHSRRTVYQFVPRALAARRGAALDLHQGSTPHGEYTHVAIGAASDELSDHLRHD